MTVKKFTLDAGHGGIQPGAIGTKNIPEKSITLPVVLEVGKHLKRHGQIVNYTRTTDIDISLQERCDIANNANCDYFISIHANSFSDLKTSGTEIFYYDRSSEGRKLAQAIQDATIAYNRNVNRGVKTADYYVIKYKSFSDRMVICP